MSAIIKIVTQQKDETRPIAGWNDFMGRKTILNIKVAFGKITWYPDEKLTPIEAAIAVKELTRDGRLFGNVSKEIEKVCPVTEIEKSTPVLHLHVSGKDDVAAHPDFPWYRKNAESRPRFSVGTVWQSPSGKYFFTLQKSVTPGQFAYIVQELKKGKEGAFYANGFIEGTPKFNPDAIGPTAEEMESLGLGMDSTGTDSEIPF